MAEHYEDYNEMGIIDDVTTSSKVKEENEIIDVPSALTWIDKASEIYKKHGFWGALKGLLLIFLACIGITLVVLTTKFVANPDKIFQQYHEWQMKQKELEIKEHQELIEKRMENTPKIQNECDKLLLKTGAQRVLFLELHNNTNNIAGLPFYFADASCESMNDIVTPIASYCQQIKLSLMPFASHLFEQRTWCGSMESLKELDKAFYYKLLASNANHMAAVIVEGVETPVGMLFVMFGEDDIHDCELALMQAQHTSTKIAVLVEVDKQHKLESNKK